MKHITRDHLEKLNPHICIEDEVWRDVPGHANLEVSNWGNLRRSPYDKYYIRKGKECKKHHDQHQYVINIKTVDKHYSTLSAMVCDKEIMCHRAVALAFIFNDDPKSKVEVDHIDFNPMNPYVSNLRWVTPEENRNHSYQNVVISNGRSVREVVTDTAYASITEFCKISKIPDSTLSHAMRHNGGYLPKYDLMVEYYDKVKSVDRESDFAHIDAARVSAVRTFGRRHNLIKCVSTGQIFRSALEAEEFFNIPRCSVSEAVRSFNGYYKKKNLMFVRIDPSSLTYSECLEILPKMLEIWKSSSGGKRTTCQN